MFAQTAGVNLLIMTANVITGLIVARLLGPVGRGQLAAAMNLQVTLGAIAALGLPDAIVYFTARWPEVGVRHLRSALLPTALAGVAFGAIGYLGAPLLLASQSSNTVRVAQLYALTIPIEALWALPDRALRGSGQFRRWNMVRLVPNALWMGALVAAALSNQVRVGELLVLYFVLRAVTIGPFVGYVLRSRAGAQAPDSGTARRMLRYGLPSALSSVPSVFNSRLDQLVLAAFLPARELGLYVVAVAWAGASNGAAFAVGSILFPKVAATRARPERERALAQGVRAGVALSLGLSLLMVPLTPFVLPFLLGEQFRGAVGVAILLLGANVFSGLNTVLEEGARGLGRPGIVLLAETGGLIVLIPLLAFSVPAFGLTGAGVSAIVGYAAISVILFVFLKRTCTELTGAWMIPKPSELTGAIRRSRRPPVDETHR